MGTRLSVARSLRGLPHVVWAALVLSACSGAGGDPLTASNIGEKVGEAFCAAMSRCCQAQGAPLSENDIAACKGTAATFVLEPILFTQDLVLDEETARQCVKAAANADCSYRVHAMAVCSRVFVGHAPVGSACSSSLDCAQAPGAHAYCANGTCVAVKFFQPAGSSCSHVDPAECDVANRHWCSMSGICTAPAPVGGSCEETSPDCVQGAFCYPSPQICMPAIPAGSACDSSYACVPPTTCTNGICTAMAGNRCIYTAL